MIKNIEIRHNFVYENVVESKVEVTINFEFQQSLISKQHGKIF